VSLSIDVVAVATDGIGQVGGIGIIASRVVLTVTIIIF
jgi:hypothetical protein